LNPDHTSLRQLTQNIIDVERPLWTLGAETGELYDFLQRRATFQIDPDQDISQGETRSENGLAISPTQAAMCAWEIARTAAFIRGLSQAIQHVRDSQGHASRPLLLLYAGCGPLALLAVPMMALFPPEEVQFVMLDIHQASISSARNVIETLKFTRHVKDYVVADACEFRSTTCPPPDIIISETMNVGLANEPLVTIARQLLDQCANAILIPRSVRVDACLVDESKEFVLVEPDHAGVLPEVQRDRILLGTVFELNAENAKRWGATKCDRLPGATIEIPSPLDDRYRPMLLTTVNVHGDVILKDYDCSLTIPTPIRAAQTWRGGEQLQFEYHLSDDPRLVCRVVS